MPRILTVYAQSSLQTLVCGDYVLLSVEFDEAVEVSVADSEALKLYLNTLEYAKYYDGNSTSTLRFVYNVLLPINPFDQADLSVYGSGAWRLPVCRHLSQWQCSDRACKYNNTTSAWLALSR